jgi:hypothetical protein
VTWAKLDDKFHSHPKLAEIEPGLMLAAAGLYSMTLSWCADQLTDGQIPQVQPRRLAGQPVDNLIDELVRVGLWEKRKGGFFVHDWLDYNPSKAQVLAERERKSEAGRLGGIAAQQAKREARAQAESEQVLEQVPEQMHSTCLPSATPSASGSSGTPVPVPVPIEDLSEGVPASGDAPVDNFRDIECGEDPPEDNRTHGQRLVAYYIEEHKQVCGSEPTERQIGLLADLVGKKLRRGSSPVNVRAAIRCMVSKGKGPSTLPAFIDEAEVMAKRQPGPFPDMGPRLPPEEQARVNQEGLHKVGDVLRALKTGGKK